MFQVASSLGAGFGSMETRTHLNLLASIRSVTSNPLRKTLAISIVVRAWPTLNTVPLVLSTGAGAEVRSVTGITVFAGMLGVTLFGLFLTPVFYVALRKFVSRNGGGKLVQHGEPTIHH